MLFSYANVFTGGGGDKVLAIGRELDGGSMAKITYCNFVNTGTQGVHKAKIEMNVDIYETFN